MNKNRLISIFILILNLYFNITFSQIKDEDPTIRTASELEIGLSDTSQMQNYYNGVKNLINIVVGLGLLFQLINVIRKVARGKGDGWEAIVGWVVAIIMWEIAINTIPDMFFNNKFTIIKSQ